jgi:hypothetical protein
LFDVAYSNIDKTYFSLLALNLYEKYFLLLLIEHLQPNYSLFTGVNVTNKSDFILKTGSIAFVYWAVKLKLQCKPLYLMQRIFYADEVR